MNVYIKEYNYLPKRELRDKIIQIFFFTFIIIIMLITSIGLFNNNETPFIMFSGLFVYALYFTIRRRVLKMKRKLKSVKLNIKTHEIIITTFDNSVVETNLGLVKFTATRYGIISDLKVNHKKYFDVFCLSNYDELSSILWDNCKQTI